MLRRVWILPHQSPCSGVSYGFAVIPPNAHRKTRTVPCAGLATWPNTGLAVWQTGDNALWHFIECLFFYENVYLARLVEWVGSWPVTSLGHTAPLGTRRSSFCGNVLDTYW